MANDRVKNYLLCGAEGLLLAALLFVAFKTGQKYPLKLDSAGLNVKVDTLIQRDTIRLEKPVFQTKYIDRVQLVKVTDTIRLKDTLYMAMEREVKGYEGEDYKAQVSGIDPALDWVEVFPKTLTIQQQVQVPSPQRWKRIGWGVSAGPGVFWQPGMDNVTPGVGIVVGLRVNL